MTADQGPDVTEHPDTAESVAPPAPFDRSGDDGTTTFTDGSRTDKDDLRIVAYGETDEASAAIGLLISLGSDLSEPLVLLLSRVQNDLLDLGVDLCTPSGGRAGSPAPRIDEGYIARLERACDYFGAQLPPPPSFVIPGGTATAALLHHARTVVRRAERATVRARQKFGDSVNPVLGAYLNRLANLLFILAREANAEHGDPLWQPGLSTALGGYELWEAPREATEEL